MPKKTVSRPQEWIHLLDQDERFQLLLEQMGTIITEYDSDGHTGHVSSSVTAVLGYDPADLVGGATARFTHPDDLAATIRLRDSSEERAGRRTT